jgi:hypothetical protein
MYCVVKNASLVHEQHKFFQTEEGKKAIEYYKKQMGININSELDNNKQEFSDSNINIAPRNIPNIEVKYKDLLN